MWYVFQVYTGTEEDVCSQCRNLVTEKNEDVFVMKAEQITKIHGQWSQITNRLFPSYVFIETYKIEDFLYA